MPIQKIKDWSFYQKLVRFILFIGIIFFALLYLGSLIVPNWEIFILYPIWHQVAGYLTLGAIIFFLCLIVIVFISLAVERQVLEEDNKRLNQKILDFEKELRRLQN